MSIYVETLIRAPLDKLWQHTQDPSLHERWDLRFNTIRYLPRASEAEPQRFLYATRIGFGIAISGEGESIGTRVGDDGERTSSLKFWSDDPKSLILEGSGYWKYVPTSEGVRFLTWYDYRTRFGRLGYIFDFAFQPLLGWATAWSFDRLRLWLEQGLDPAFTMRRWLTHAIARLTLAAVFAYHGLVPKLLFRDPDEIAMLRNAGASGDATDILLVLAGVAELLFSLALLVFWRRRWPATVTILLMAMATLVVAISSPKFLSAAFNPVSLNFAIIALAAVDLINLKGLPTATRCHRAPQETTG